MIFKGTMAMAGEADDATVDQGGVAAGSRHGHQAELWDTRHISN
jgi:hypothetical protein